MSAVASLLPSSITRISSGCRLCCSTDSSVARIVCPALYAGMSTLIFMIPE